MIKATITEIVNQGNTIQISYSLTNEDEPNYFIAEIINVDPLKEAEDIRSIVQARVDALNTVYTPTNPDIAALVGEEVG